MLPEERNIEPKLPKRKEREIGAEIEKVAKKACLKAAKEKFRTNSEDGIVASYNMGWQRRGQAQVMVLNVGATLDY